jgi:putative transposase
MSQSLSRLHVHLVFSTKGRVPCLRDDFRDAMHGYMATVLNNTGCPVALINSVEDHVHILFELGRTVAVSDAVKSVKTASSAWVKTKDTALADFAWQPGFGAFSVSESNTEAVRHYIATQRQHHERVSFQDEYRTLLIKNGTTFDERHLWE